MKDIRRLPEGEMELMQIIWNCEPPVSRTEIEEKLAKDHPLAATTILTLLTRLCDRGFLSMSKQGRNNVYTPNIVKREYLASESRTILDKLYGGSLCNFATALCDSGISKEEIQQLKEMLEEGRL